MSFEADSFKTKALKGNYEVHIPKLVTLSIFVACSAFVLLYTFGDEEIRQILIFTMPVLAGGGTVYGAFYAKAAFISNIERDRIEHTLEMLASQNTPDFVSLFIYLRNNVSNESVFDWQAVIKKDPKLEISLNLVLASFEDMADAVYLKQIDERTIYMANAEMMPISWNQLKNYIKLVRTMRQSDAYMSKFEMLCQYWAAGKYVSGGDIAVEDLMSTCPLPADYFTQPERGAKLTTNTSPAASS